MKKPVFFEEFENKTVKHYENLKNAIERGDAAFVTAYLANRNNPITDSMEDPGYPDVDGFIINNNHGLLYEAVPHPAVLEILLNDDRFDPNGFNNMAFYHCLHLGSIEGLELFANNCRFIIPDDAFKKAAELGGREVIEYFLELNLSESGTLFTTDKIEDALQIATQNNDEEIIEILNDYLDYVANGNSNKLK